jgi:hypothetical protein
MFVWSNLYSRAQTWNPLKEKTTQYGCEPKVPHSHLFSIRQLALHVGK